VVIYSSCQFAVTSSHKLSLESFALINTLVHSLFSHSSNCIFCIKESSIHEQKSIFGPIVNLSPFARESILMRSPSNEKTTPLGIFWLRLQAKAPIGVIVYINPFPFSQSRGKAVNASIARTISVYLKVKIAHHWIYSESYDFCYGWINLWI